MTQPSEGKFNLSISSIIKVYSFFSEIHIPLQYGNISSAFSVTAICYLMTKLNKDPSSGEKESLKDKVIATPINVATIKMMIVHGSSSSPKIVST